MENEDYPKSILKSRNLYLTDCRLHVLGKFLNTDNALTQKDLENQFNQYDRVTLYRTIHSFLNAGIIHKIPGSEGVPSYALCHDNCAPNHHYHNHVHFKCNNCGQVHCLDNEPVPKVNLPKGYRIESVNMILDGVCVKCS